MEMGPLEAWSSPSGQRLVIEFRRIPAHEQIAEYQYRDVEKAILMDEIRSQFRIAEAPLRHVRPHRSLTRLHEQAAAPHGQVQGGGPIEPGALARDGFEGDAALREKLSRGGAGGSALATVEDRWGHAAVLLCVIRRAAVCAACRAAIQAIRGAAIIVVLLGVLVGCRSGEEWTYDKPRVTAGQLDRDLTQCRQIARPTGTFAYPSLTGPDREALNKCMEKRGYTVIRRPEGG
jgi:hypothetical protein